MIYDQYLTVVHNSSKFAPCPQKCTCTYEFDLKPVLVCEPAMDTSLEIIFTAKSKYKKPGQMQMLQMCLAGINPQISYKTTLTTAEIWPKLSIRQLIDLKLKNLLREECIKAINKHRRDLRV